MKDQKLCEDMISMLPQNIIETILCLVPIQVAARTSILSREWRYKWTTIPKLVFNGCQFRVSSYENQVVSVLEQRLSEFMSKVLTDESETEGSSDDSEIEQESADEYEIEDSADESEIEEGSADERMMVTNLKIFYAIYQVLLVHQGPIVDVTLSIFVKKTIVNLDNIISQLSRNHAVKNLCLVFINDMPVHYRIPSTIFSFHMLVNLYLSGCDLNHRPTFNGFGSLKTLYLKEVSITNKTLLHLLSSCPLLKMLTLKLDEDDLICDDDDFTFIELLKCLPAIEHLTTWSSILECFTLDSVPQELPASLIHLRYFYLEHFCSGRGDGLYLLALLIRWAPNLEKIRIQMTDEEYFNDEVNSVLIKACSGIRLEHLNEVDIFGFGNMKPDLEFVKFILARSPKLKKLRINAYELDENEESKLLNILSSFLTTSPLVEIIVN